MQKKETETDELYFAWFHTQANLKPTPEEEREKIEAIREQIREKVLQPNGLPYGYDTPTPAEPKKLKETPWQKQQRKKAEENKRKSYKGYITNTFLIIT